MCSIWSSGTPFAHVLRGMTETMTIKDLAPTRSILLLMSIGFIDLLSTAVLHAQGRIVELNPLMRPLIEHSEWTFASVKGSVLLIAWAAMVYYARIDKEFVRRCCLLGSVAYSILWVVWFVAGSLQR